MGAIATRFKFKADETESCEGEEDKAISNKKTFSPVKWVKGFRKKLHYLMVDRILYFFCQNFCHNLHFQSNEFL